MQVKMERFLKGLIHLMPLLGFSVDWSASERQTRAVAELLTGPDDADAETDPRPPK
jgi:hypothetical protein